MQDIRQNPDLGGLSERCQGGTACLRHECANVLGDQIELLFLDHAYLPDLARTFRVDLRTMLSNPTVYTLVSDAA